MAIMITAGTTIQAQKTTSDITKKADVVPGTTSTGGAIKVIDNKGTIKYLQVENGLTMLSNTSKDVTTTTWQLGEPLVSNTNITTGTQEFKLTLKDGANQGTFVLDGVVQEPSAAAGTIGGTGWTLLTRDETTGQIKELLANDLVSGIRVEHTQSADTTADQAINVTGLTAGTGTITHATVPMYKNNIVEIQYIKKSLI